MLVWKRTHLRALDVMQAQIDTLTRDHSRMVQRNTANVAENVRLFVKNCKAEDRITELQMQNEDLRDDYLTLRLAYECLEKATKLAVAEMNEAA